MLKHSRKLILTSLDWTRPKDPPLSLGHASILSNLIKHSVNVIPYSWSVNDDAFSTDHVTDAVMQHADPNTDFAIGAFVWNERYTMQILHQLKQYQFPGRIILGGPQISYVKQQIEQYYPQADIFIRGYAEDALAQLMLSSQQYPVIKGVHYANHIDLGESANVDFESLPSPYLTGIIQPQRFIRWETQRGCPFKCSFCQHRASDESQKRKQFSLSRIAAEAAWITQHKVIQDIAVLDPTFNAGPQYLFALEALISGGYTGKLALQSRAEMVNTEFLDAISALNKTARVVLEFGLQTIHKEEQKAIQRPNNLKKIAMIFDEAHKRNIEIEVSLIFGLPHQTVASFQQSIEFCKMLGVKTIHAFPLMLLRGTPLYAQKENFGLVESTDYDIASIDRVFFDIPHVIASPSFSLTDWKEMSKIASDLEIYNKRNRSLVLCQSSSSFFKDEPSHNVFYQPGFSKLNTPVLKL